MAKLGFTEQCEMFEALRVLSASIALLMLTLHAPGVAAGIITGAPSLTAGAGVGTAMTVGSMATLGAAGAGAVMSGATRGGIAAAKAAPGAVREMARAGGAAFETFRGGKGGGGSPSTGGTGGGSKRSSATRATFTVAGEVAREASGKSAGAVKDAFNRNAKKPWQAGQDFVQEKVAAAESRKGRRSETARPDPSDSPSGDNPSSGGDDPGNDRGAGRNQRAKQSTSKEWTADGFQGPKEDNSDRQPPIHRPSPGADSGERNTAPPDDAPPASGAETPGSNRESGPTAKGGSSERRSKTSRRSRGKPISPSRMVGKIRNGSQSEMPSGGMRLPIPLRDEDFDGE